MAYSFALITGATSGIGEAFARELPRETALLLTGRDAERLELLADELSGGGRRVESLAADLATEAGRAAVAALAGGLPIDLLINNAGLGLFGPLVESPPERARQMIELNCLAPLMLTRALLPAMLERAQAEGRPAGLIMVASTAAFMPLPRLAAYAASKAFDLFLAEGLAGELAGEPVHVLALCPGATRTKFFERADFALGPTLPMADPRRVAREGLEALGRRTVHVVGRGNRIMATAARLLPRPLLQAGTRRGMSRIRGAKTGR